MDKDAALGLDGLPLPSVRELVAVLGPRTLDLRSSTAGLELAVTHLVLHDPWTDPEPVLAGLLLGAGLRPDSPELPQVCTRAAAAGFNAIALKAYDTDTKDAAHLADQAGMALLAVPDDLGWLQLEKLLATALEGARHRVSPALSSLQTGDLFALANVIATTTGGATAIEDLNARVLAYSTIPGQEIDDERRDGILGRQVPPLVANDEQYRLLATTTTPHWLPSHSGGMGRVAIGIHAAGEPLGSIWVVDTQEGTLAGDVNSILSQSAQIASLHLLRHRSSQDFARQHRADLLGRVLRTGDLAAAAELGLDRGSRVAVLAVEASTPDGAPDPTRLVSALAWELETRVSSAGCIAYDTHIYGIVPVGTRTDDGFAQLAREVVGGAERAVRIPLRAGLGPIVTGAAQIGESRRAADQVLVALRREGTHSAVRSSRDLADRLAIQALARQHQEPGSVSVTAAAVLAHDREKGSAYAPLILAWLGSGRDVASTAQSFNLHANTVRYRLERCRELFGVRTEDPDHVLALWLGLRIADENGELTN